MNKISKEQEIIKILFKDFLNDYNSRSISKPVGISHVGAFKILKKLEKREIVISRQIGRAIIYKINMQNPVALREVEMILTIEAQNNKKWVEEFSKIKKNARFVVLFGSILRNEREAKDIDILIAGEGDRFNYIKKEINDKNLILNKKIHPVYQTIADFKIDVNRKNKVIIDAIKTGIVLFGQEEITKILRDINEPL